MKDTSFCLECQSPAESSLCATLFVLKYRPRSRSISKSASILVHKIRSLLAASDLSLAKISRASRTGLPDRPIGRIPHNLYDAVGSRQFSPSFYQIATLSIVSGYRFGDWLELFGFSLDNVSRFQILFPATRTVELDHRVYQPGRKFAWFRDVAPALLSGPLSPLSKWLMVAGSRRADSLGALDASAFRFFKIGSQDAFAFPDLLPGSIVRVNPRLSREFVRSLGSVSGRDRFLIECGRGLICSSIFLNKQNQVVLSPTELAYGFAELNRDQIEIFGVADLEIRRIVKMDKPTVPHTLRAYWKPGALPPPVPHGNVGAFMQRARRRAGISFREASARTAVIARTLRDPRYFCAPGSLSDYETKRTLPRHIHKTISMCAVYFASVADLLETAGLALEAPNALPIPPEILEDKERGEVAGPGRANGSENLRQIESQFQQLPYFLGGGMAAFFGMPDLSIRDVFWAAGVRRFAHPYLDGAALFIVDRRKKVSRSFPSCPAWAQPLHVFLRRDGSYLCGSYSRQNGTMLIHPCTEELPQLLRLDERTDVEVVGQIVGVIRRLR